MSPQMGRYTLQDDIARMAAHVATLDAHTLNPYEQFRIGNYINPCFGGPLNGNFTLAQYTMYAVLIHLARPVTFDRIAGHIEVADAGNFIRLGVYNSALLYPTTLVANGDCGLISTAAVGTQEIALAANIILTSGYYFLVEITNSAAVAATTYVAGLTAEGVMNSPLGIDLATFEQFGIGWAVAAAAAEYAALPANFPAGAAIVWALPSTGLRVLSLN